MNNFVFKSPTEFVFGRNAEQEAGRLSLRYGANKVLLLYGGRHAEESGLLSRVMGALEQCGIPIHLMGGIQPNPTDDKVYEGIARVRQHGIDFLLAVGGGSVIDTAKAIAAGALYEGDFWDFYAGVHPVERALPVGVVLTIPAAGSEASGNSVITKRDGLHKISLRTGDVLRPKFACMNPELTFSLPPFQTACGVADMMSHIMERYFSNTLNVDLTDRLCEAALQSIVLSARQVMADSHNYEARANLMWAGTVAHSGILGVGREEDWASHFMEHEVSAVYGVAHGAGLSVVQPAWLTWMTVHRPEKVAQFALRVWGVPERKDLRFVAVEGVRCLKQFFHEIGLPTTFRELGVEQPDVPLLVEKLHEDKGELIGNYVKLDRRATREIYEMCIS